MALETSCYHLELDVRLTRDNQVIVILDETVDRTTNSSGRIGKMLLEAVKRLDAGSWKHPRFAGEPVPTLEEVLES